MGYGLTKIQYEWTLLEGGYVREDPGGTVYGPMKREQVMPFIAERKRVVQEMEMNMRLARVH